MENPVKLISTKLNLASFSNNKDNTAGYRWGVRKVKTYLWDPSKNKLGYMPPHLSGLEGGSLRCFSHMQSESFFGFPLPRRETWCLSHIPPWNSSLIMMPLRPSTQKPVRKFRCRSMGRLCAFIAWCRGKEWSPRDQFCFNWNTFSCYHHLHNPKLFIVKKKQSLDENWKN